MASSRFGKRALSNVLEDMHYARARPVEVFLGPLVMGYSLLRCLFPDYTDAVSEHFRAVRERFPHITVHDGEGGYLPSTNAVAPQPRAPLTEHERDQQSNYGA